ncbi:hypothetical protein [Erwinia amylovora]
MKQRKPNQRVQALTRTECEHIEPFCMLWGEGTQSCPSSFTPQPRRLPSRTPVTYRCKPVSYTHLDVYKRQRPALTQ